jgi:uncharacterized protein
VKAAVTGSTGLIGSAVVDALRADGHQVVRLVRRPPAAADEAAWDPLAPAGGLDAAALDGVTAVVHLAAAGVADRRWTAAYKAKIRDSRVRATQALVAGLMAMSARPDVLISGSAVGWYGDTGGREVSETAPAGTGFLPELVRDWEAAALAAGQAGIRVVTMRTGLVMTPTGGVLARLLPLFRLGLGARLGPGTQVMSWIGLGDLVSAVRFMLDRPALGGPVNATAPGAVTNREFTSALAAAVHRPAFLAVPTPALRLALGGVASDLLSSARVTPARLTAAGFRFQHPTLPAALAAELHASRHG